MQNAQFVNFARKYRPKRFSEVIGQTPVVTTLKNALTMQRVGSAYLFCGTRGSGKTTIARLLAKALNCLCPDSHEPCNQCSMCLDISASRSLDVIEIDGASNRGIDDIRAINETVAYAPSSGKYKIYLIDEVHMLTKEAFNALLKTLEEPPSHVKFFFATTEPHKLPSTIISRCQRFDLKTLKKEEIVQSLQGISLQEGLQIDEQALSLIAKSADGSLRDAQSLFDLVVCSLSPPFNPEELSQLLGIIPFEEFEKLDHAIFDGHLDFAFTMSEKLFAKGCDYLVFTNQLLEHFRSHLQSFFAQTDKGVFYSKAQILYILDQIILFLQNIPPSGFSKTYLEALLLRILRSRNQVSLDTLTQKLVDLEKRIQSQIENNSQEDRFDNIAATPHVTTQVLDSLEEAPPSSLMPKEKELEAVPTPVAILENPKPTQNIDPVEALKKRATYDTILHFTKEVLEGTLKK